MPKSNSVLTGYKGCTTVDRAMFYAPYIPMSLEYVDHWRATSIHADTNPFVIIEGYRATGDGFIEMREAVEKWIAGNTRDGFYWDSEIVPHRTRLAIITDKLFFVDMDDAMLFYVTFSAKQPLP